MPLSFREICRPQCVLSIVNFAFRWTLLTSYCAVPGTVFLDLWWHSSTRSFSVLWTMVCSTIEEICTRNRSSGLEKSWFLCNVSCCTSCKKSPELWRVTYSHHHGVYRHQLKQRDRPSREEGHAHVDNNSGNSAEADVNENNHSTEHFSSEYGVYRHRMTDRNRP